MKNEFGCYKCEGNTIGVWVLTENKFVLEVTQIDKGLPIVFLERNEAIELARYILKKAGEPYE